MLLRETWDGHVLPNPVLIPWHGPCCQRIAVKIRMENFLQSQLTHCLSLGVAAIFWPKLRKAVHQSINSYSIFLSSLTFMAAPADQESDCFATQGQPFLQNGNSLQKPDYLVSQNAPGTFRYSSGLFKGSYSTSIPCTRRVLVGFCCLHFHGPWKWRQQRPTKRFSHIFTYQKTLSAINNL